MQSSLLKNREQLKVFHFIPLRGLTLLSELIAITQDSLDSNEGIVIRRKTIDNSIIVKHSNSPIMHKELVSVLNRPFLHRVYSKRHDNLLVYDSKSGNPSGHCYVSS